MPPVPAALRQPLRFRQIHLDFHTSEKIPGVGSKFSKQQFQEMLQLGHVDSVTVFSKCHHGLSYHQTKVGVRHPHLECELLPLQLEACAEIGVEAPVYISAGLDEAMAAVHPEWCIQHKDGKTFDPLRAGWKTMSFSSPYLDYLCAQIEEAVTMFNPIGIFLDIIHPHRDYSIWALAKMRELGLDPKSDADADTYAQIAIDDYFKRTTAACKVRDAQTRVFHNSGHIAKGAHEFLAWNSHLELESLPTGGWGYDHFPVSAKYAATTGYDFLGMTGKFHTTWGEFGGFKRPEALQYECSAMLSFGSKCSVGDQLHPNGEMSRDTYALIGAAYSQVEAKEAWAWNASAVNEIAIISPEAFYTKLLGQGRNKGQSEEGASRMLLELKHSFDVIDLDADFAQYKVLILPDEISFDAGEVRQNLLEKLRKYLHNGGKIMASGDSGLNEDKSAFELPFGLDIVGKSEWNPDFVQATELLPNVPVRGRFVVHHGAWDVRAQASTSHLQVLAERAIPYFNREWDHFCSHQHTPDAEAIEFPAATFNGQTVYFAHPIFKCYRDLGQMLYRDLVSDALQLLLPNKQIETNLPSSGRVSLMQQKDENRYILHLLHAVPIKRGADSSAWGGGKTSVEVIEELLPVHDVEITLRLPQTPKSARIVPENTTLELSQNDDAVSFVLPKLHGHAMIELSY